MSHEDGRGKLRARFFCFSALCAANSVNPRKDKQLAQMCACIGMFPTSVMLLTSVRYET
jgi:hypothetical protein